MIATVNQGIMKLMMLMAASESRIMNAAATAMTALRDTESVMALVFWSRAKTNAQARMAGKIASNARNNPKSSIVAMLFSLKQFSDAFQESVAGAVLGRFFGDEPDNYSKDKDDEDDFCGVAVPPAEHI